VKKLGVPSSYGWPASPQDANGLPSSFQCQVIDAEKNASETTSMPPRTKDTRIGTMEPPMNTGITRMQNKKPQGKLKAAAVNEYLTAVTMRASYGGDWSSGIR